MKPLFCGALLLSSLVNWPDGLDLTPRPSDVPTESAQTQTATTAPVLTNVPKLIVLPRDRSAVVVTVNGSSFGPDVSVRFSNMNYTFTYGQGSLTVKDSKTLEFDGSSLEDGVYSVYVRAGSFRSREMAVTVSHK